MSNSFSDNKTSAGAEESTFSTSTSFKNPSILFLWVVRLLLCSSIDATNLITTIAGTGVSGSSGDGGPASSAQLRQPRHIWRNSVGMFYVSDQIGQAVRKFSSSDYIISTFAGIDQVNTPSADGGPASSSSIVSPIGVQTDLLGRVIVVENGNAKIRRIDTNGIISTIAGECNFLVIFDLINSCFLNTQVVAPTILTREDLLLPQV